MVVQDSTNYGTLRYKSGKCDVSITEADGEGLTTDEFKDLCVRMALALGYQDANVQECFNEGDEYMEIVEEMRDEIKTLRSLLDAKS